ncbi:MAG: hypothetical protein IJP03_06450 [Christensenellaceae bacterium]|nr:hypothetical protein [Christensenellaceae bacterium]
MKFEKIFRADVNRCYSAGGTVVDGKLKFLLGTELQGAALCVDAQTLKTEEACPGPGGTMSLIPIPGKNGDFLHIHSFFPVFQSAAAGILWTRKTADGWQTEKLVDLPYVHRFDLFEQEGRIWFIGATLGTTKMEKDDWSDPGKLWVGLLPEAPGEEMKLTPVLEGLVKNHGYCHVNWQGKDAALVTCESGVYVVYPPVAGSEEWTFEHIIERPISDVAISDLDGDGEPELLLLEDFHGDKITINKKVDGEYKVVWEYPKTVQFVHVAWGGKLRGKPAFLCGTRRLDGGLFVITWDGEKYVTEDIEVGTLPANAYVANGKDFDLILAANHGIDEGAIYKVTD